MASSELLDVSRFSGGKSNFLETSNILNWYLTGTGSSGDLDLGLTKSFKSKGAPTGTMNLFPITEKLGQNLGKDQTEKISNIGYYSEMKLKGETAQMTIFYDGQVLVLKDFQSDKAKEIILLASKSSGSGSTGNQCNFQDIAHDFGLLEFAHSSRQPTLASDFPIARKNSLVRFLKKRKERYSPSAPYQAKKIDATVKAKAWLRLGPQFLP